MSFDFLTVEMYTYILQVVRYVQLNTDFNCLTLFFFHVDWAGSVKRYVLAMTINIFITVSVTVLVKTTTCRAD